ncbi:GNAT family N-acetyltransferase [Deinococcus cellulosilyticus]|uniref:N-acetyltransferase n=1 Tax=Deinococcus cellulosilyticus (strain DSM 18568 / NBRC 106333 / KACC 11606 / 5516J-15) TaxID=1223518 RepID=A0A511N1M6_DEIC1|nr:GNAT family protein [Deinococcus cellulosilyticus]GEM46246.1 N-acetyltransferase [Deinococcus cellulosilyticus NBRC 106333 = KACC 11606]
MTQWLQAPTLTGRTLRLERLTVDHAPGILEHMDEDTGQYLSRGGPAELTLDSLSLYLKELIALPNRVNWAVVTHGGQVAGRISYSEVRPADRWMEIGTMLTAPFRGTSVNPEAKLLLMERAFEVLGANRVHFKVDSRNARSLRAMEKLGAVREGTLRRYQVRPDGYARDSVMFSLLPEEWPEVKARLEARVTAWIEANSGVSI